MDLKNLIILKETLKNLELVAEKLKANISEIENSVLLSRDELHYTIEDFKNGHRAPKID